MAREAGSVDPYPDWGIPKLVLIRYLQCAEVGRILFPDV